MADVATAYALSVVSGEVPAGRMHIASCQRHLDDLENGAERGLVWDYAAVEKFDRFARKLRHVKGSDFAGKPLRLADYQLFYVGSLLGWKIESTGLRRYREALVELPRGSGKSSVAAALLLYLTFFDGEAGADGFTIASKRRQARGVFDTARNMALRSALANRLNVQQHAILHEKSASRIEPLGRDSHGEHGHRPHIVIADEVHAMADDGLIEVMRTGMGTRTQPLLFMITTAGRGRTSPWYQAREYSQRILAGDVQDDSVFAFIACANPEDDYREESTWIKANPSWNISVKPEHIRDSARKAEQIPDKRSDFRQLHLGQLVEEQSSAYLSMPAWDASLLRETPDLEGRPCYLGLDLASKQDLTALVALWPGIPSPDELYVKAWAWLPEERIEAATPTERQQYRRWVEQGYLQTTPGALMRYSMVRERISDLASEHDVKCCAYDQYGAAPFAISSMIEEGLPESMFLDVPQGYHLSDATKELSSLIVAHKIRHDGNPILRWCLANLHTVASTSTSRVKPVKPMSGKSIQWAAKIDCAMALLDALSRHMVEKASKPAKKKSTYGQGFEFIVA